MPESLLDKGLDIGDRAFTRARGDIRCLSEPIKTIVLVGCAQTRIDNGGFRYFLETDWVGNPPYSEFSDALRTIGADANADAMDAAVKELGFGNPEMDVERRLKVLDGPRGARIEKLERRYVDDVWQLLERFIVKHKDALFGKKAASALSRKAKRRKQ